MKFDIAKIAELFDQKTTSKTNNKEYDDEGDARCSSRQNRNDTIEQKHKSWTVVLVEPHTTSP